MNATDVRAERAEVTAALHALQLAFEDLVVRGLEATGPDDVRRLEAIGEELARAGAGYAASVIGALVRGVRESGRDNARLLLRAQTVMRVFERVFSLDAAAEMLSDANEPGSAGGDEPAPPAHEPPVREDKTALVPVLEELARTIEGLVGSGMTTASAATKHKLDASFQEASRLKLLRLAMSLRYVSDECGRFIADSEHFSARRLAFFLNRTWLIGCGLLDAIAKDDRAALARLLLTSPVVPVKAMKVAVVGVQKRALLDGSASFEFRLRTLADVEGVPRGAKLVWSCVFGARKSVPAEAFLHLPQPQKFAPRILLEPTEILITDAAVTLDDSGYGRVMLGPRSTIAPGAAQQAVAELVQFDRKRAVDRIRRHRTSPLDLEVELQEDLVLRDWSAGTPATSQYKKEQTIFPITAGPLRLDAIVSNGPDGEELMTAMRSFQRAKRPPLYGLLHYEMGRMLFQPLTAFADDGPRHLMISRDKIDLASLMKTLDFTS